MAKDYLKAYSGYSTTQKNWQDKKLRKHEEGRQKQLVKGLNKLKSFVKVPSPKARDFNEITVDERNAGRNKLVSMGFKPKQHRESR